MSVFRPLNSDESNLFTIRCSFSWSSEPSAATILADQTTSGNNSYLETPTFNNLPQNFKVTYTNTGYVEIEYGKSFTTHPTIFATVRSANAASTTEDGDALTTCVSKQSTLSISSGTTNATVGFRAEDGTLTAPPKGFDIILVGPIKVGVTTGNSNKGWSIGSGNDPNTVYSYLNVGISTGKPGYALEVAGEATFRTNISAQTESFNPSSEESGTTYTVDATSGAIAILLPTPVSGLRYKFIVKDTSSEDITITSTSDGSAAANISYANLIVGGDAYSQTTLSDVLTLGNLATDHTIGDWVECICDGTNWWWSGVVVVASSAVLA